LESAARKIRVFHIDDDPDACRLMSYVLESEADLEEAGSRTDVAGLSGDLARNRADVLLIDLTLGREDAIEAIREVRRVHPEVRIVVLSGCSDPRILKNARDAGAEECVLKSPRIERMLEAIRRTTPTVAAGPPSAS